MHTSSPLAHIDQCCCFLAGFQDQGLVLSTLADVCAELLDLSNIMGRLPLFQGEFVHGMIC